MSYKYESHSPVKYKQLSWMVCANCGLIYIRNEITQWALKKGCNHTEHPEYGGMLKKCSIPIK